MRAKFLFFFVVLICFHQIPAYSQNPPPAPIEVPVPAQLVNAIQNPAAMPTPPGAPPATAVDPNAQAPLVQQNPNPIAPIPFPQNIAAEFQKLLQDQAGSTMEMLKNLDIMKSNPLFLPVLKIFMDKDVRSAAMKIIDTSKSSGKNLLLYEIIWVVFIFFLKNFEYSKLQKGDFFKRCWVGIWTSLLSLAGLFLVIPLVIYGMPYVELVQGIIRCLRS